MVVSEQGRRDAIDLARDWASREYVALDTETTGLGELARIVEISCIDRTGNILVDSLVNPGGPIPAEATAIHGISDADVAGAPTFPALWPRVLEAVRGAEVIPVYNAAYDQRLIRQSLAGHEAALVQAARLACCCIMDIYAQFFGAYSYDHGSYTWQKLTEAVVQCGLEVEGTAHRALADVRAARAVLNHMAEA